MNLSNPPLQLLRVFGEELELGAVALWVFPRVIVTNFSWKNERKNEPKEMLTSILNDYLGFEEISGCHLVTHTLIDTVKYCSCLYLHLKLHVFMSQRVHVHTL